MEKEKEVVFRLCKEHDIKFIRLWFTDILGFLKGFALTVDELETAIEEGMGFDGSSIQGYARSDESEMISKPDLKTFQMLPWRPKEKAVARMFADIYEPDGCPDPACNPYLAFAVMLAAGLKGIEEGYELPEPVEEDIFEMSEEAREKHGIESLPGNLYDAIRNTERSELVKETLGDHILNKFIANKKIEWDPYRTHVSQFELEKYLSLL